MPYGAAKIAAFPRFVDFVNSDPKVDLVAHVGDIKNGSSLCTDDYILSIRDQFNRFKDPFVYTPGDNEWTDCHRANNGNYKPAGPGADTAHGGDLSRLDFIRANFFPTAGQTLGRRTKTVASEGAEPSYSTFVENVMWMESRVVFADFNVPGSNDDDPITDPWTGAWAGNAEQGQEKTARDAANLHWLSETFATATANNAQGVVLLLQADMWDPAAVGHLGAFDSFVQAIGSAAITFGKPVLLIVGDSHVFKVDNPYDGTQDAFHPGFTPHTDNVTRIVLEGSTTVATRFEYLRLTVDPKSKTDQLFGWDRVDFNF
jgi:hypothetical protein